MNENIDSIYMELYGMLNQHTIPYYKTYIDLALLGAYTGKKFLNDEEITKLSQDIQIKKPEQLGIIHIQPNEYKLELIDKYYAQTRNYNNKTGKSLDDILGYLKEYLDKLNTINITEKGKIRYEGAVLRDDGNYIKSKPKSYFEAEGRIILNVSPGEVKKEIHKILDERSELLLGDYDEKKVIEEININLEEEYDKTDVYHPRVQKMVLKQLHEFIETLPSKSLQNTVNDLIEENPGLSIGEYMQKFSRENPLLKHKSRLVYNMIIKKLK